jgi:hypothetical protein
MPHNPLYTTSCLQSATAACAVPLGCCAPLATLACLRLPLPEVDARLLAALSCSAAATLDKPVRACGAGDVVLCDVPKSPPEDDVAAAVVFASAGAATTWLVVSAAESSWPDVEGELPGDGVASPSSSFSSSKTEPSLSDMCAAGPPLALCHAMVRSCLRDCTADSCCSAMGC